MIDFKYVKSIANPKELAVHYLGRPVIDKGRAYWYHSPFRNDNNPSFEVDDVGFYDFATNDRYDVFSFVQSICHVSFIEATKIVAKFYGIEDNEYETDEMRKQIQQAIIAGQIHRWNLKRWYTEFCIFVEHEFDTYANVLEAIDYTNDGYNMVLDRYTFLGALRDDLRIVVSPEEQEDMQKRVKEDVPKWMKEDLKNYITTLGDLSTIQMAKIGCLATSLN